MSLYNWVAWGEGNVFTFGFYVWQFPRIDKQQAFIDLPYALG